MIELRYESYTRGKGGQHTNGPEYGLVIASDDAAGVEVKICTRMARGQHRARELAMTLCQMAVSEIKGDA